MQAPTAVDTRVLRRTNALCPECLACVPAEVREEEGEIRLRKRCPRHGESAALLSRHPDYWRDVERFYFSVMRVSHPQRDYILRLTERCNLDCPICLAGANEEVLADFSAAEVERLVRRLGKAKYDLMGCEPTVMDDLPAIIATIRRAGGISALHSNGLALAEDGYLDRLVAAGLDEVHLQFDGLDERAYEVIRGKPLLAVKEKAMANLARLEVPVDLVMTVLAGVNEEQVGKVLQFGARQPVVKEVFFLGCRMLGRAAGRFETAQLMPDQVIDLVAEASGGRISRERVRRFQKLYFTFLSIFGVRKCLYIQHYLLLRDGRDGWRTVDEVLDLGRLEPVLERFRARRERESRWATPLFFLEALPHVLRPRFLLLAGEFLTLGLLMKFGFNLRRVKKRSILLGYITACDPLIYDTQVAENCGKGEISRDLGFQEAGALANCMREHRWRRQA